MIKPLGMDHASVTVEDIDRSLSFYRDLLGMSVLGRGELDGDTSTTDGIRIAWADLDPGDGGVLEVVQYLMPLGKPLQQSVCDPGSGHIAVRVTDAYAAHDELVHAGVRVLTSPSTLADPDRWAGVTFFYALDPDGQTVEIIQRPQRAG
ncbi:VOC family protein [Nocardia sp. NPDC047648]|uniref:VOC family protein n=1 Tax=Nocardia sp. NPDC047648 TaxID=3155625 RepID=UPI0033D358BF